MERSREAKKLNGLSKRRQRSIGFRDSTGDGGSKNERDREYELLNRNKRRKGDKHVQGSGREEEESAEDSLFEEEEGNEAEHSNRNISQPSRVATHAPPLRVADEMIGVPVPRRARSACVKRLPEWLIYRNGGYVDEHNYWRPWAWPASRSTESPSSSTVSVRKKMKPNGTQTNDSNFSSSAPEDIEIEIAEALYGLMKLSHGRKDNDEGKSADKLESEDANDLSHDTNQSIASPAVRPFESHSRPWVLDDHKSDSLFSSSPNKNETEIEESANPVRSSLIRVSVEAENDQAAEPGTSPQELDVAARSNLDSCAANLDKGSNEKLEIELGDSKSSVGESNCVDESVKEKKSVLSKEGSAKLDSILIDSMVTKAVSTLSEAESQRQEKFKIDLMAPPPMVSSPETVDILDLALPCNQKAENKEMNAQISANNEGLVVKDRELENTEGKRSGVTRSRPATLKPDSETPHNNCGNSSKLEKPGSKEHVPKTILPKWEKNVQSSLLPLPVALAGWSNTIPPLGYLPPFQISSMDGGAASCGSLQSHVLFSQPRSKKCSTHGYIARNIHLQQQYAKMNPFFPASAGSASMCGGKTNNINLMSPAGNLIIGNSLQGDFPAVNLNNAEEKGQIVSNLTGRNRKDKSSDGANQMDTTQGRQFMLQRGPQPASAGNLMHAPAFVFPKNQSGPSTAAATNNKVHVSNNLPAGTSSMLLGPTAALSSSYTNLGSGEAPYLTIIQNNGYPFSISAPAGNPAAIRGGAPAQALPIFNGSVYSSQIFHPQFQQQHPHLRPMIQPANPSVSTSSGSSSTSKQPERQPQQGVQVGGSTCLSTINMLSHQKSVYGQKAIPQPLNFTLVSPATIAGSNGGGNQSEKQQQSQQKSVKGGVDLIPSQAFAVSFGSLGGHNIPSNLNFSSMAHSPAIFHSLPGVAQPGYQVAPAIQPMQQKIQVPDGKSGSSNFDSGKKGSGKSHATSSNTLVFDNAARTLNFGSSPATGNWSACSIAATSLPANLPIVSISSNSRQQLLQVQKQQHVLQHQSSGTTRSKAQETSSLPASSIAAKFSSNATAFPQSNSFGPSKWQNSKMPASEVSFTSPAISNAKNHPQQLPRASQGQTQISFGGNSNPPLSVQGQQVPATSGRTGSGGTTLQPQQGENSNGPGQKSSPACGRNVPSILSTCPSHLSELKY